MTISPEQANSATLTAAAWPPDTIRAFTDMCQNEGLNPVRLRRLVDRYADTKRKPSRQELIDALKHRPRIKDRAATLGSINKTLSLFLDDINSTVS